MSSVQSQNPALTVTQALSAEGSSTTYSPLRSAESWLGQAPDWDLKPLVEDVQTKALSPPEYEFEDFEFVFSSRTPSSSAFSPHEGDAVLLDTPFGTALCSTSSLSNTSNSLSSPRCTSSTCIPQPPAPFVAGAEDSQSDETLVVGLAEIEAAAKEAMENPLSSYTSLGPKALMYPSTTSTVHPEAGPSTAVRSGSPPRGNKRRRSEIQKTDDMDERSPAGRVMSDEEDVPVAGPSRLPKRSKREPTPPPSSYDVPAAPVAPEPRRCGMNNGCDYILTGDRLLDQAHLNRHGKATVGAQGFRCTYLGCTSTIEYTAKCSRNKHVKKEHWRETFACDVPGCDKRYGREDQVANHKRRVHKV
ncbi:hypothetical protein FKP32DRAFT_1671221 [Trametes sanguinea]|nr:hypothetical protein FKP32DRAFT_1671221 [Trametes sanguinea]